MEMVIRRGADGKVERVEYAPSRARMAAYAVLCEFGVLFFLFGCARNIGHFFFADAGHWFATAFDFVTFFLFLSLTGHYQLLSRLYFKLFRREPKIVLERDFLQYEVRGENPSFLQWDDFVKTDNYNLVFKSGPQVPLPPEFWKWHSERAFLQELLEDTVLSKLTKSAFGFKNLPLYDYEPEENN